MNNNGKNPDLAISIIERLQKKSPEYLTTLTEIMGHKVYERMIRILSADFNELDYKTFNRYVTDLKSLIRSACYVISDSLQSDREEPGHAFFWRGLARLKIGDQEGKIDIERAYIIYEYWEKTNSDMLFDDSYLEAKEYYNEEPNLDKIDKFRHKKLKSLREKMQNYRDEWIIAGAYSLIS